nr:hypothetical protein [uncultured Rhodopila sp.]
MAALMPGTAPIADTHSRADAFDAVWATGKPALYGLIDVRPAAPLGHVMRAAAFLVHDAGEMLRRARAVQMIENRLLAAILIDLAARG